jgi:ABC-type multidrug transport system ATPase subunit
MVAPYLQVYDEFTPVELILLQRRMHGEHQDRDEVLQTLARVGLADRADEMVRTLSSGLRQRVILALAVHRNPAFLMLDEPTNTLDAEGRRIVEREVQMHQQRNGVVVIATNDDWEKQLCTHFIEFGASASSALV